MPLSRISLMACATWLLASPGVSTGAGICELNSPQHRQALLELYTSEGCNSCPPADQWLSRLRADPQRTKVVPLAFHVDYWNRLGWPDRFSQAQFTHRQQAAADRNRAEFVYTPQFLLDGRDIRPLQGGATFATRLNAIATQPAAAHIDARARAESLGSLRVEGHSRTEPPVADAETFIAVYENGLVSAVARGENAGKTLRHDYVVRALVGPLRSGVDGVTRFDQRVTLPGDADAARLGIAIFTQARDSGRVLQASAAENCLTP